MKQTPLAGIFVMVLATFGETLDAMTLIGAAVVVGSGVFVAWREYQLQLRAKALARL